MSIKKIFDEIANESSTNQKMVILVKYKDNELLKRVLYLSNSKRVKFYIKQIPEYKTDIPHLSLEDALIMLEKLSKREVTGHDAQNHLKNILSGLDIDNAYIIERVIEKDCKIGLGTRMLNKIWPDLIERTGYMGCKPYSKELVEKLFKANKEVYSEVKLDGRYVNIIIMGGEVEQESRQGEPTILDNPKYLDELKQLPDCVLNAEMIMGGGISRYESNGIIASLISIANKKNEGEDVTKEIRKFEEKHMPYREALDLIKVVSWDILEVDEYFNRSSKTPYQVRFAKLNKVLAGLKMVSVVEAKIVHSIEEAMAHFTEMITRGEEGTVLKSMNGEWKDGKPSTQIKVKKEINLDLKIVGFNYGKKGSKNEFVISSIDVESSDGKLKTSPAGIDEETMRDITENQEKLMGTIVEVKCSGISQDSTGAYSLLHPVYKHARADKSIANSLEECIEIHNSSNLL